MRERGEPNPGGSERVDAESEELLPGPPYLRRGPRLLWAAIAAAVFALIIVRALQSDGRKAAGPTSRPSTPPSRASQTRPSAPLSSSGTTATTTPAVTVTQVGRPLLGITAGWDLFARGTATMVRIEFAHGRITRTAVPALASSGPVSFLAAPHAAIIRPLDFVLGYLIPDGQPPRPLTGALASGGVLLPGPGSGQFWLKRDAGRKAYMVLVGANGQPIRSPHSRRIAMPSPLNSYPLPDGAGYVLLARSGGVDDLRPGSVDRITKGSVLAVGPTRWLAAECTTPTRCSLIDVDQATGARHVLRTTLRDAAGGTGAISSDGRTAALLLPTNAANGPPVLHLLDLSTGVDRRVAVPYDQNGSAFLGDRLVWSPDSRWLFTVDVHGQLRAVDARAGRDRDLNVVLPPVKQLAIR
jgi:hypothetical protein